MKLEIKLNQEQFDLLVTSLVLIAQNTVRMANAWDTEQKEATKEDPEEDTKEDPKNFYKCSWTDAEIDKAITLYREGKTIQEIAEYFPGRTHDGVYFALLRRGLNVKKDTVKYKNTTYPIIKKPKNASYNRKERWTPEEDEKIIHWVKVFGPKNWKDLAKALPGRTEEAVRTRWKRELNN